MGLVLEFKNKNKNVLNYVHNYILLFYFILLHYVAQLQGT